MRTKMLVICLLAPLLLLSGCAKTVQLENQAFAILLGIDKAEEELAVTVQIAKMGGGPSSEDEKKGGSGGASGDYLYATAQGKTFSEALEYLRLSLPRGLNLSQIKLIVVSEELAGSGLLPTVANEILHTHQLYSTAYFAVCQGTAKEFLEKTKPIIGSRISSGILAKFDHYADMGYIHQSTFADFLYGIDSVLYDPVAVIAGIRAEGTDISAEAAESALYPSNLPAETENEAEFIGTALFSDGRMIASLDGEETGFFNLLTGRAPSFRFEAEGMQVMLEPLRRRNVHIDLKAEYPLIEIGLSLKYTPLSSGIDKTALENAVREKVIALISRCKGLGIDPFHFSEAALRSFSTWEAWAAYDWQERFRNGQVFVSVNLNGVEG